MSLFGSLLFLFLVILGHFRFPFGSHWLVLGRVNSFWVFLHQLKVFLGQFRSPFE